MKSLKKKLTFLSILILAIACQKKTSPVVTPTTQLDTLDNGEIINATKTKNSLSWPGDYTGNIPSTSSIGIKMKLSLSSFDKYNLEIKTLNDNPKENKIHHYSGKIQWSEDSTTLSLVGFDSLSNKFKLSENEVIYLNPDGTPNSGALAEFYKLKKVVK